MLPQAFRESMERLLGPEASAFFAAMEQKATTAVRLHPTKGEGLFPDAAALPWSHLGRKLAARPSFTLDPLFHAGSYYVQDASSQFLETALGPLDQPVLVLDACAAPGGKTTHLESLVPSGSIVIANEVIGSRARILQENLWKWGMPDVILTSADPRILARAALQVDVLVVDAPCSGEGLFRKDRDAIKEWSPRNVDLCAARQKRILGDLWPLLRPGGVLLYSTCTWNEQENEGVLAWVQEELGGELVPLSGAPHIRDGICRFLPQDEAGEGFTCGMIRKVGAEMASAKKVPLPKEMQEARAWAKQAVTGEPLAIVFGDTVHAVPVHLQKTLGALQAAKVPVLGAGTPLADLFGKKKDFKPHPMLAHSVVFNEQQFPSVELDHEQALAYLRRSDVQLEGSQGRVVVTHKGRRLGWGKLQNGRLSSQYPMDYRIRH